MLESFIYSLNIIAPIFIIVVLGVVLKKINFLNDSFVSICDKLVFKLCLPALLFIDTAEADAGEVMNLQFVVFCCLAVIATFLLGCLIVPIFVKDRAKCGSFIQGMYRSNSAILGVTLATNMFGEIGSATIAMVLPFVVVLFNVFAVVLLSFYAPEDVKLKPAAMFRRIVKTVITNPLIIAILLAFVWKLTRLEMPILMTRSINYLADMSMPLALLSLGSNFTLEALKGRVGMAIAASIGKTVIIPLLAVVSAVFMGFTGVELGVVFILFGGPTAVSSYIMAKQMKSDYELASQILLISTLMSLFTLFAGIFTLKTTGLI